MFLVIVSNAAPWTYLGDREVNARLRALGVAPSGPSCDPEFLRRVTLDVIGTLPTPNEVRAFLEDPSADKRSAAIDRLRCRCQIGGRLPAELVTASVVVIDRSVSPRRWRCPDSNVPQQLPRGCRTRSSSRRRKEWRGNAEILLGQ